MLRQTIANLLGFRKKNPSAPIVLSAAEESERALRAEQTREREQREADQKRAAEERTKAEDQERAASARAKRAADWRARELAKGN